MRVIKVAHSADQCFNIPPQTSVSGNGGVAIQHPPTKHPPQRLKHFIYGRTPRWSSAAPGTTVTGALWDTYVISGI